MCASSVADSNNSASCSPVSTSSVRGLREMAKLASDMSNPAMTSVISTSSSVNPSFRYLIAINRYPHHFPRRLVVHPCRSCRYRSRHECRGSDIDSGDATDHCAHTLLLRWIAAVTQPVELERLGDGLDVVFCRQPARLIWTAHNLGHHKRGQDAENRNDNHHFD